MLNYRRNKMIDNLAWVIILIIISVAFMIGYTFAYAKIQRECREHNGFPGLYDEYYQIRSYYHCTRVE